MNLNKALIIGRITKDPEARTTSGGKAVTAFSIATNKFWTDASGNKQESTEYHNVVMWGKLAEIAAQYLVKGQEVFVEGRIQTRSWEGKDGIKRYTTEIIADNMQMGSKPQNYSGARTASPAASAYVSPAVRSSAEPDFGQSADAIAEAPQQSYQENNDEVRIEDLPF